MKKKTVKMVSAVVVLGVLCGAYLGVKSYTDRLEQQEAESQTEETTEVFSVDSSEVVSIKFLIDKKEVVFKKDGENWVKEDETEFPVDQDTITSAVSTISSVTAGRVLTDVESTAEYGLDNPTNTITVTTEDGEETVLKIGSENESVSQYYVEKDEDGDTVYLIDTSYVEPFINTLYDYAEGETFPNINSDNVTKIKVDEEEKSYTMEKDEEDGFWYVSSNTTDKEKADSAKSTSIASAVGTLEYSDFVDYNCEDLSQYGLEDPYAVVVVDYEEEASEETDESTSDESASDESASDESESDESASDESTSDEGTSDEDTSDEEAEMISKQLTLYVGDEAENDCRYVRVDNSNEIYTIAQENLDTVLNKQASDLLDMTINYVSVNQLEKLEILRNGETHTIDVSRETSETDDGESQETLSYLLDGETVDSTLFTTFYNKAINMTGQRRLSDEETFEPQENGEMKLVFTNVNGETTQVEFWEYDTNYHAAVVGEKIYLVNKMTVKEMYESYETLLGEDTEE